MHALKLAKLLQSCLTLCHPMDCSLPGSSVHGILQARVLVGVAMPFYRESSPPRDRTHVSYISCGGGGGRGVVLYHWCHMGSPFMKDICIEVSPLFIDLTKYKHIVVSPALSSIIYFFIGSLNFHYFSKSEIWKYFITYLLLNTYKVTIAKLCL